ncbi:homeobox-leucine zipper protein REVOLUTA-like [Trifolium pratense]|uniref:Homeobox-leucine zipper protein REVOLUTA-like n=1 Tax=Trifolium pratense TaxID=57577 RepID=A0A2K3LHR6_TRIPR|nr:homeobox-leucine zipper protein REVOLUTA-like [Trifolium pratense]
MDSYCRSLSGSGAGPNAAAASQFERTKMLPSGNLIRSCEGKKLKKTSGEVVYGMGQQPAVQRTFSQRLSRYVTHNLPPCKLFQPAV